jgi:hypothetical protein
MSSKQEVKKKHPATREHKHHKTGMPQPAPEPVPNADPAPPASPSAPIPDAAPAPDPTTQAPNTNDPNAAD